MKNKILNRLVTVKSIVTLVLTLVFAYLSTVGAIPSDKFQDIFYIIIAFYFVSSLEKTAKSVGVDTE